MMSNIERFQKIQKQANSESYSLLIHVDPQNLPQDPPSFGQDDLSHLSAQTFGISVKTRLN